MHDWDSDYSHFGDIGEAAEYLGNFCRRWGRMYGQTKEKYGTVRFYCSPSGLRSLMDITHPGYVSYANAGYPKWLTTFDIYYVPRIMNLKIFYPLQWAVYKWRCFIYKKAYSNAVKKWPHIREEILSCADALEMLDNCDDIKLDWNPPSFSEKDKKRIGPHILKKIEELRKKTDNARVLKGLIDQLILEGRLTTKELEYLKEYADDSEIS